VGQIVFEGFETLVEDVRSVLDKSGGGAFCVYLNGEAVVDVWSGSKDPSAGQPWERDTLAMSWSTTKGVTSTVLHMLIERELLAYDEPLATYWPEFGVNGKSAITLRQLMSMEAGLYDVRHLVDDPSEMLDHSKMVSRLELAEPLYEPGKSAYHAFTYGWLAGSWSGGSQGLRLVSS